MDIRSKLAVLVALWQSSIGAGANEDDWPIEPITSDHPLGNTLGEFVVNASGKYYQHNGIDILATPYPEPSAPFAVVTTGGTVVWVNMTPNGQDNFVRIEESTGGNGVFEYSYHHLEYSMLSLQLKLYFNNTNPANQNNAAFWPKMHAGDLIAKIHNSFVCDFDHLHYQVERVRDDGTIIDVNPLVRIEEKQDEKAPEVKELFLAKKSDSGWHEFDFDETEQCTVVRGNVEIVAEMTDHDDAGPGASEPSAVMPYEIRWSACKFGGSECDWKVAYRFNDMKSTWSDADSSLAEERFSLSLPWVSIPEAWLKSDNACPVEQNGQSGPFGRTFMILTSVAAGGPWKTGASRGANGKYTVSVEASDIVGNKSASKDRVVCVRN